MEWKSLLADFANRTKANLDYIYDELRKGNTQVYEVTQLVNSLLGLVVFPDQYERRQVFDTSNAAGVCQVDMGSGLLVSVKYGAQAGKKVCNKKTILRKLRHAVAHFGMEAESWQGEIRSLTFYNKNQNEKYPDDWVVVGPVLVDDLRSLVEVLAQDISAQAQSLPDEIGVMSKNGSS